MDSQAATQHEVRLTSKQRNFVRAYALQGMRQADAYRASYQSSGNPRTVSSQAHRLMRTPAVRAAISLIQDGNIEALISFGFAPEALAIKKLFAMADNEDFPSYVRVRALQSALRYERLSSKSEPAIASKRWGPEELERLLRETNGVCDEEDSAQNSFEDDELSLDYDPLPVRTVKANGGAWGRSPMEESRRANPDRSPSHPFLTRPQANR